MPVTRAGMRFAPWCSMAFVDDTATLGLDVELQPSGRGASRSLLKAAAIAGDDPSGGIPQLVTESDTRRIRRKLGFGGTNLPGPGVGLGTLLLFP